MGNFVPSRLASAYFNLKALHLADNHPEVMKIDTNCCNCPSAMPRKEWGMVGLLLSATSHWWICDNLSEAFLFDPGFTSHFLLEFFGGKLDAEGSRCLLQLVRV